MSLFPRLSYTECTVSETFTTEEWMKIGNDTHKRKSNDFDAPFPKVRTSTSSLPDEQKLKPANKKIWEYM